MGTSAKPLDLVICNAGQAQHATSTAYGAKPALGDVVEGATCEVTAATTKLKFSRPAEKTGKWTNPITPGVPQLCSVGTGGSWGSHNNRQAVTEFDFGGGEIDTSLPAAPWQVFVHFICMCLAWGAMLPSGVLFSLVRDKLTANNGWFPMHRSLQVTGWTLQLIAFCFIFFFVADAGYDHFQPNHTHWGLTVVILGTLQPFNAAIRPHPEPRTGARVAWEIVHKGCGYTAVVLGIYTIMLGVRLVEENYSTTTHTVAVIMACVCVSCPILVLIKAIAAPVQKDSDDADELDQKPLGSLGAAPVEQVELS